MSTNEAVNSGDDFSPTYLLLLNEGHLMQGCFKSSLAALRAGSSAERGLFYVAFFNYSIGLERLLKLILLLDFWHREKRLPTDLELKGFGGKSGHNVQSAYDRAKALFSLYSVKLESHVQPDKIDAKLLSFVCDFAMGNRYFNLDALAGGTNSKDPLIEWQQLLHDVYECDVHPLRRVSSEDQIDAFVAETEANTVHVPSTSMSGSEKGQSYSEFCRDHGRIKLVLPELSWRLVKLLVPLQSLLIALEDQIRGESIPCMWEFLDFVSSDKSAILESSDWPYFV